MGNRLKEKREEATRTEIEGHDETTTQNEPNKTAEVENPVEYRTSSVTNTSFDLDVSSKPQSPTPIENPPKTPELPPIVVSYNARKVGRYNLRPKPKPNAKTELAWQCQFLEYDLTKQT